MLDSGCTEHITNDLGDFTTYTSFYLPKKVSVAKSGATMDYLGIGSIYAKVQYNGKTTPIYLERVLYIPDAAHKYISTRALDEKGYLVLYGQGQVRIINDKQNKVLFEGQLDRNQYWLRLLIVPPSVNSVRTSKKVGIDIWHQRFGHASFSILEQLNKSNNTVVKGYHVDMGVQKHQETDICLFWLIASNCV